MFKSIRWTLQLWHASLLALVLIGFGAATYYGTSQMRYHEVDADLERSVQLLAAGMRPEPPMRPDGQGRGPDFRGRDRRDDFGGPPGGPGGPGDPYRGPGGPGDGRRGRFGPNLELPPTIAARFTDGENGGMYYSIWAFEGNLIKTSRAAANAADNPPPAPAYPGPPRAEPAVFRQNGAYRETYVYGFGGTRVLVGRSIVNERAQLHRLAWLLGTTGAGVLALGLLGGWLVSLRVVRPIQTISQTAQDISASNLSKRIDVEGTKSELGALASVLNDMFARLDSAFQQQVRFTADASHELRTPLAVIHTNAQLALSRERTPEEYQKTLATCLRASGRMKGLVDSLLFLAGADAGRVSLQRQSFDLRDVADECITMIAPLAAEKHVTVESDLQSVELDADPSRLAQVITNLLSNGIRYNRDGGQLRVTLRIERADAVLEISDTGVGIPPEHQAHLFERFYRVDVARSRDVGGSGLGLAICKSIVDAHRGSISFISEVDKGTTFTVRLPIGVTEPIPATTPMLPAPATSEPAATA